MKPLDTVIIMLLAIVGALYGMGLGLASCLVAEQRGVTHKFFTPETRIVCSVKEK